MPVKTLTKADILKASDLPRVIVAVPEWGGDVYVRTLTAAERDQYDESNLVEQKDGTRKFSGLQLRARLCSLAICDESGRRLFDDDDVDALAEKSALALERVYEAACRLSMLDPKAEARIEKNSETAPADAG